MTFDEFMAERQQQPLSQKRLPATLGTPENPQNTTGRGPNTGIGATVGALLGTGASLLPAAAVATKSPAGGVGLAESIISGFSAGGDLAESLVQKSLHGEPLTLQESDFASAGDAALVSAAGGLVGRGVVSGFQKSARFFRESVTPEAREAINFLREFRPDTQFFTASEMTENRLLDIVNNFAEHSVWGGGDIRKFKLNRDSVLAEISKDIADRIGSHKDSINVGKMVLNIRNRGNELGKIPATNMYKVVEQGSQNLFASTKPLKAFVKPFSDRNVALERFGQDLTGLNLAEKITKFKDTMKVSDLMAFQRAIKAKVRSLQSAVETSKSPAIKFLGDVDNKVNELVENGLRQPGTDLNLLATKRQADAIWRSNKEKFSNDLVNDLVKIVAKNPNGVAKHILVSEQQGAESLIRAFKRTQIMKGNTQAWQIVQRNTVEELYRAATDVTTGMMSGKKLLNSLIGPKGIGKRALNELYGSEGASTITRFAKALSETQKKTPATEGSLAIQFTQMGAVLAVSAGSFKREALGLLIGPKLLAKLMTSPRGADLLLKASKMSKSNPEWPALSTKIAGLVSSAEFKREKEEQDKTLRDILKTENLLSPF